MTTPEQAALYDFNNMVKNSEGGIYLSPNSINIIRTALERMAGQSVGEIPEDEKFFFRRMMTEKQMLENRRSTGEPLKADEYILSIPREVYERLIELSIKYMRIAATAPKICDRAAEELAEALREARPYVPEHHGPVNYKIEQALTEYEERRKK